MKNINFYILFTSFMLCVHSVFGSSSFPRIVYGSRGYSDRDSQLEVAVQAGNIEKIKERLFACRLWDEKVLNNALQRFDKPAIGYPEILPMLPGDRDTLKKQIKDLFSTCTTVKI